MTTPDRERFTIQRICDLDLPEHVDIGPVLNRLANEWEAEVRERGCEPIGPPNTQFSRDTPAFLADKGMLVATGMVRPITPEARQAAAQRAMEATA